MRRLIYENHERVSSKNFQHLEEDIYFKQSELIIYFLRCNTVQTGSSMFRRNVQPPPPRSKSNPSREAVGNRWKAERSVKFYRITRRYTAEYNTLESLHRGTETACPLESRQTCSLQHNNGNKIWYILS